MKKQKLTLNELKIKSFVTTRDEMNAETLKGGRGGDLYISGVVNCVSDFVKCPELSDAGVFCHDTVQCKTKVPTHP